MEKISPRVDICFKKLFGVEENKDLLVSLINSIVGKDDQVSDVTLLNPYNSQNFKQDKLSILDIKAKGMGAIGGVASLILIQLAIMEFDRWFREQQKKAKEENKANYLKITSGQTTLGQDYKVSRNIFGKITYRNQ